ncbi:50S ribosomal protein L23 [Candidatus Kaiserbacteria bacterium CG10_big_fil_rev_8_21_14_0_10_43_70]|uniref:Large ribosomal subunit protein uL23 n=1 Tax=Candidatus Kaiserbacteria bacterium CG10_big_fil_rev_8_21_14_0_10_43_70 TaxID=1974605 RepID=A0A2H0UJH1_9BACT|nr:MAG: 50S ribosomal protein L23 [Candidatus Kaiserbacteria bacterium CG10_big_fil_rev_8_21_14_0_10_43_70]
MALFSRKDKKEEVKEASASPITPKVKKEKKFGAENISSILVSPRITEKATEKTASGVYVFDVAVGANKKQIEKAIRALYKVEPRKIRITQVPAKKVRNARTGIIGVKKGGKKAYIYLKDGDSISVM